MPCRGLGVKSKVRAVQQAFEHGKFPKSLTRPSAFSALHFLTSRGGSRHAIVPIGPLRGPCGQQRQAQEADTSTKRPILFGTRSARRLSWQVEEYGGARDVEPDQATGVLYVSTYSRQMSGSCGARSINDRRVLFQDRTEARSDGVSFPLVLPQRVSAC